MARRDALETAVRTVLSAALPGWLVVWRDQEFARSPRPSVPYLAARVASDVRVGHHGSKLTTTPDGDLFVRELTSWREAVVRCDLYGDGAADAARELDVQLRDTTVRSVAKTSGVTPTGVLSILDETAVQDSTWQRRAQVDVRFRYLDRDTTLRDYAAESLDLTLNTD